MDENKKVSKIYEKTEYIWIIDNFMELMNVHKMGNFKESVVFSGASEGRKYSWKLRIYPTGDHKSGNIALYLVPASAFECFAKYSFVLKNSNDDVIIMKKKLEHTFEKGSTGNGFSPLVSHEKIKTSLQEDNILKISVVVWAEVLVLQSYHIPDMQENKVPELKQSREFGVMCNSDKFSDFVFKFEDGSEIKAHRCILSARSQVFSAMFEHDDLEKSSGSTKITDIEMKTMAALLNFLYTGKVVDWSVEEAKKLVYAANKYQLDDLKQHCENILVDDINVSNALEILQIADRHNLSQLKDKTLEYIVESKNFSDPNKLRPLLNNNQHLMMELFLKCRIKIK